MPGRKRRYLSTGLLFDFFRSHVPRFYPADNTLLGLDHEPIIAAGTLNHRRKNFSLIQLVQLFQLIILAREETGIIDRHNQASRQTSHVAFDHGAARDTSLGYSPRRSSTHDSLTVRDASDRSTILGEGLGEDGRRKK